MQDILSRYRLDGTLIQCVPVGTGHINKTFLVVTARPRLYILQNINTHVFRDPEGLMRNIVRVTEHIRTREKDPRRVLTLVPAEDGAMFVRSGEEYWRMYDYITGSVCLDRAESAEDFRQSGSAFGQFQRQLADFPAAELCEVIPGFHDTPKRYEALKKAVREDVCGRAKTCGDEIGFYLRREESAGRMVSMLRSGELPLRVTHNDTKLNNVMLDEKTRKPLCVIDLDTVMPGLAANDFGDSIRFGASTAAEDERDLSRVRLSMDLYRAYAEGFLGACGGSLTPLEKETLPEGARLMTLECGARFLTDYLEGDVYFHTEREGQNLDRARTQMKLVAEMEARMGEMTSAIEAIARSKQG